MIKFTGVNNGFFLTVPSKDFVVYVHDKNILPVNHEIPSILPLSHVMVNFGNVSKRATIITLTKNEIIRKPSKNSTCISESETKLNFASCWEEKSLKDLGCKFRWHPKSSSLPDCKNVTQLKDFSMTQIGNNYLNARDFTESLGCFGHCNTDYFLASRHFLANDYEDKALGSGENIIYFAFKSNEVR